jgi:two-component system KDP operon response regulator KdpE
MSLGAKILVIDDETSILKMIRSLLELEGYSVLTSTSGEEGLFKFRQERPDLVLLDLGLPDLSGQAVLERIRELSHCPVIILTVQDHQSDKVALFESGADDYMTKPFGVPELLARIKVAFRHCYTHTTDSIFTHNGLQIDFLSRCVTFKNTPTSLTTTEYDLLKLLVMNTGKLVTTHTLLREIWKENSMEYRHYLRIYISQLRKKLNFPELEGWIVTVSGIGYRLEPPAQ